MLVCYFSAGVGRTGTFLALDYLLDQAKNEGILDVYGYVKQLRRQRPNMIQTHVRKNLCNQIILNKDS